MLRMDITKEGEGNIDGEVLNELLMYMPQDVSTSMSTSWGGKEITNAAAGMLAGYANLSTGDVGGVMQNVGAGLQGLMHYLLPLLQH